MLQVTWENYRTDSFLLRFLSITVPDFWIGTNSYRGLLLYPFTRSPDYVTCVPFKFKSELVTGLRLHSLRRIGDLRGLVRSWVPSPPLFHQCLLDRLNIFVKSRSILKSPHIGRNNWSLSSFNRTVRFGNTLFQKKHTHTHTQSLQPFVTPTVYHCLLRSLSGSPPQSEKNCWSRGPFIVSFLSEWRVGVGPHVIR